MPKTARHAPARRLRFSDVQRVSTSELREADVILNQAGSDRFGPYWEADTVLRREADTIGCKGRHFATGITSAPITGPNACFPANSEWWVASK